MAGGMCDCGGAGLNTMSTSDLEALLNIMKKGDPGTALAIKVELGMRKARICYEGYGGA